jgi:hypothetical protein
MVDWIDGTLSESEILKLVEASGRSDIRQRVQQLQKNRALLASLPTEAPPIDLHDRVLAALERDTLLGVSAEQWAQVEESSQPIATLPQDRLGSQRDTSNRAWWQAAPTLAMAASILLLVGGGVLLYPTIKAALKPSPVQPIGPIASNGGKTNNSQPNDGSGVQPAIENTQSGDSGINIAGNTLGATSPDVGAAAIAAAETPIDLARAVELAREGRLIVRVVAKDTSSLARVETAATNPQSRLGWRLSKEVPPSVVAMMMPRAPGEPTMAMSARERTASLLSAFASPGAALSLPNPQTIAQNKVRGTYVLDVQQSSAGLSQALDMLSKGLNATIEFERSAEPMPMHREVRPQDVMWWNQPSSQWMDRVAVPIIVQRG